MKSLPRRTFLRGLGTAIALPFLDAMVPAFGATGKLAKAPSRLMFVYAPTGVIPKYWFPEATGTDFAFPRTIKPLEKFRADITIVSNLAHHNALALGDGPGDHARAASTYLTGMHIKKTEGADLRAGVSVDQIAARKFEKETRFPSLELTCEDSRQAGACDSYSCAYQNIAWRSETQPLPPEMNPRAVFERLFGDVDTSLDAAARARQQAYRKSILDQTREDTQRLMADLGPADRRKMDEYLTGIREVELKITAAERDPVTPPSEKPSGIPFEYKDYVKLMFDLQAIGFQSDLTRVSTMMLGREGSVRTYPEIGVPDPHHPLTHHRGHPDFIEKVTKINCFHVELFASFVEKLKATPDGDGALLDHSAILYGCALSDGNAHSNKDLPLVVAGHAGGLKGGQHVAAEQGTPVSNLFVQLMNCVGLETERFADSTGQLDLCA